MITHSGPTLNDRGAWVVVYTIDGVVWPGVPFDSKAEAEAGITQRYTSYCQGAAEDYHRQKAAYAEKVTSSAGATALERAEYVYRTWEHARLAQDVCTRQDGPPRVPGGFSRAIFDSMVNAILRTGDGG